MPHPRRYLRALQPSGTAIETDADATPTAPSLPSPFSGSGVVGGSAFRDEDNDGRFGVDATPQTSGVADINVWLFSCDGPPQSLAYAKTASNGIYRFTNPAGGKYYVVVQPPDGYAFSSVHNDGNMFGDGTVDSTVDPDTGRTICFELGDGEKTMDWSFGLHEPTDGPSASPSTSKAPSSTASGAPSVALSAAPSTSPSTGQPPTRRPTPAPEPKPNAFLPTLTPSRHPTFILLSTQKPSDGFAPIHTPTSSPALPSVPAPIPAKPSIPPQPSMTSSYPTSSSAFATNIPTKPTPETLYYDTDWLDLPWEIRDAYIILGYNEAIWEGVGTAYSEDWDWVEFTPEMKEAAWLIGYTEESWCAEGGGAYTAGPATAPSRGPRWPTSSPTFTSPPSNRLSGAPVFAGAGGLDGGSNNPYGGNVGNGGDNSSGNNNSGDGSSGGSGGVVLATTFGVLAIVALVLAMGLLVMSHRKRKRERDREDVSETRSVPSNVFRDDWNASAPAMSGENSPPPAVQTAVEAAVEAIHDDDPSIYGNLSWHSSLGSSYRSGENAVAAPRYSHRPVAELPSALSHMATEAESENIRSLEREVDGLTTALHAYPQNSSAWLLLHSYLERAREELDAARQDIASEGTRSGDATQLQIQPMRSSDGRQDVVHSTEEREAVPLSTATEISSQSSQQGVLLRSNVEQSWDELDADHHTTGNRSLIVDVIAPPGNLGLVVHRRPGGGPVFIRNFHPLSPLLGRLQLDDEIMAVDDASVRQLSPIEVGELLSQRRMNPERKITVLRRNDLSHFERPLPTDGVGLDQQQNESSSSTHKNGEAEEPGPGSGHKHVTFQTPGNATESSNTNKETTSALAVRGQDQEEWDDPLQEEQFASPTINVKQYLSSLLKGSLLKGSLLKGDTDDDASEASFHTARDREGTSPTSMTVNSDLEANELIQAEEGRHGQQSDGVLSWYGDVGRSIRDVPSQITVREYRLQSSAASHQKLPVEVRETGNGEETEESAKIESSIRKILSEDNLASSPTESSASTSSAEMPTSPGRDLLSEPSKTGPDESHSTCPGPVKGSQVQMTDQIQMENEDAKCQPVNARAMVEEGRLAVDANTEDGDQLSESEDSDDSSAAVMPTSPRRDLPSELLGGSTLDENYSPLSPPIIDRHLAKQVEKEPANIIEATTEEERLAADAKTKGGDEIVHVKEDDAKKQAVAAQEERLAAKAMAETQRQEQEEELACRMGRIRAIFAEAINLAEEDGEESTGQQDASEQGEVDSDAVRLAGAKLAEVLMEGEAELAGLEQECQQEQEEELANRMARGQAIAAEAIKLAEEDMLGVERTVNREIEVYTPSHSHNDSAIELLKEVTDQPDEQPRHITSKALGVTAKAEHIKASSPRMESTGQQIVSGQGKVDSHVLELAEAKLAEASMEREAESAEFSPSKESPPTENAAKFQEPKTMKKSMSFADELARMYSETKTPSPSSGSSIGSGVETVVKTARSPAGLRPYRSAGNTPSPTTRKGTSLMKSPEVARNTPAEGQTSTPVRNDFASMLARRAEEIHTPSTSDGSTPKSGGSASVDPKTPSPENESLGETHKEYLGSDGIGLNKKAMAEMKEASNLMQTGRSSAEGGKDAMKEPTSDEPSPLSAPPRQAVAESFRQGEESRLNSAAPENDDDGGDVDDSVSSQDVPRSDSETSGDWMEKNQPEIKVHAEQDDSDSITSEAEGIPDSVRQLFRDADETLRAELSSPIMMEDTTEKMAESGEGVASREDLMKPGAFIVGPQSEKLDGKDEGKTMESGDALSVSRLPVEVKDAQAELVQSEEVQGNASGQAKEDTPRSKKRKKKRLSPASPKAVLDKEGGSSNTLLDELWGS